MKNNKKRLVMIIIAVFVLIITAVGYYILNRQDKETTLTLIEKQWIESNKNKVVTFGVLNNIPVLSSDGEGVVFDFFKSLEETTNISFNKSPYLSISDAKDEYIFKESKKVNKNDILLYQDNYVLVIKEEIKYQNQEDIKDLTIGVLDDDLSNANKYLKNGQNLSFKTYGTKEELLASFANETNALVIPRLNYLELLMNNQKGYNIAYNIIEMNNNYVFSLGENKTLNTILNKYFKKWFNENFIDNFDKHFTNNYFAFNEIDNKEKVKFRSKRYVYGFLEQLPYDSLVSNNLVGINSTVLSGFSRLADVEISYKKYNSINNLLKDFNANNIDVFYSMNSNTKYKMDTLKTVGIIDANSVIAIPLDSNIKINSLSSLEGKEVLVLKDSVLEKELKNFKVDLKSYNNYNEMFKKISNESIVALPFNSYQYFMKNDLKNYYIGHQFKTNSTSPFTLRSVKENEIFNEFFKFYISYINDDDVLSDSYSQLLSLNQNRSIFLSIVNVLGYILFVITLSYELIKFIKKKSKKEPVLTKTDKLKYIDMLTSLKNRNYLNDNIEKWDSSEVYPQAIIVVDLNNVAYINDNYGYQEGDKLISQAANILINSQVTNSDIIRTSGNEFLIYLVGYDEKQVVAYMRRLNKEFRELNHGFGAALGYSIVLDGIKTIDDAINEATLDMRTNKENIEE